MMVAETIRRKVQGWSDEPAMSTVSIGIASITPTEAVDWPQFVNAADKALYAAKHAGRNCCVMAPMPAVPLAA
jgi:PleD family two-component response regulator